MKFLKILFLFFILSFTQQQCNAQDQIECFKKLLITIGQQSLLPEDLTITNICNLTPNVGCDNTQIISLQFTQISNTLLTSEVACLKYLQVLSISNAVLSDEFLAIDSTFSNYVSLELKSPQQFIIPTQSFSKYISSLSIHLAYTYSHGVQFSLDIFNTISNVNFIDLTDGNQKIEFTEATTQYPLNNRNISLFSKNLPSLNHLTNIDSLSIDLQSEFDVSSIENYYTYSNVLKSIEIKSITNQQTCFTSKVIEGQNKMSINQLKLSICMESLTDKIDLSENYGSLYMVDLEFPSNKSQEFLISGVPKTLSYFKMGKSSFNNLITPFSILSNVSTVDLSFNEISDQALPIYINPQSRRIQTLNLSNNKLTGILDSSYCQIPNLIIRNNLLNGNLNDCYLCYMKDPIISSNLDNNGFENLNLVNKSCFGKVIPRLRLDSGKIYMQGLNLGFNSSRITTTPPLNWNLELASTLYSADFSTYKDRRQLFKIKYEIPSLEFTLRATPIQFIVTNYTSYPDNSTIIFRGSDFTYNVANVKITIGDYQCKTLLATFSTLECMLMDDSSNRIIIKDSLEDLVTTIVITNPDDVNIVFTLQLTSSFHSTNVLNVQVTPCPNLCNGNGICYSSGHCQCTEPITYDIDCKTGTNCSTSCGLGSCDYSNGKCKCPPNWGDNSCSTPLHYISAIDPCTIEGGNVIIHGWFSRLNDDLTIKIGSLDCIKTSVNETTIECNLGAGVGTKNVNITQNGVILNLENRFQYIDPIQQCLNNCTAPDHGICDTSNGVCNCLGNWVGFDCSLVKPIGNGNGNGNGSTTIDNNGTTTIGDSYQVSILSLVEFDINGQPVKSYYLNNHWKVEVNNNTYNFSQKLNNTECLIVYSIEEVKEDSKSFEFANVHFKVNQGGIKFAINISNYQYTSSLNTLQLRIQSETKLNQNSGDCNKADPEIDTSNVDPDLTLNYISLKKNNRIFTGRFINKAISDNRITYMSTKVIKELSNSTNIVLGLNLPNGNLISIDPDFSLLVSSNYKSKCDPPKPNWFLPVVIAVPIGGLAIILIASIILIKKYKYSIKLLMNSSIKLKERNP